MSSGDEKRVPTNEEVVDDLVKEFKTSCSAGEEEGPVNSEQEEAAGVSPEEKDEENKDEDFIDELALKDKEVEYTEEQKEELRLEAVGLKTKGNNEFKEGFFSSAADTYTAALRICPLAFPKERAILFANRAAAKVKLDMNDSAIADCSRAIELDETYVRPLIRRAALYETADKLDEALADFTKILELDPGNQEAHRASIRLPPLIQEKNEKLKEEMLGKLKDLGNVILKPFGLSTNNFQMVKDPNTGGYSINFQQKS